MAKELICPHCKRGLSPAGGFEHDENLNMLCGHCKGVVFAASKETENKVKHLMRSDTTGQQHWQKKDCLPIRMQQSSTIINSGPPATNTTYSGYEMYGD